LAREVGGEQVFVDEEGPGTRYVNTREPVLNKSGGVIGYHPAQTVDVTGDTRGGTAPADEEDEERAHRDRKRYGKMSGRMLALGRKDRMHETVMAAFCGELGEKYACGVLVPESVKKIKKPKKGAKPELTTGIEHKHAETEIVMVRRKGPGRIASLYHLTPSGRALLAARSGKASLPGTPEVAMRTLVTSPPDDPEYKAAIGRIAMEALELLAAASAAYTEVLGEEQYAA
jgi:hypothetical protein